MSIAPLVVRVLLIGQRHTDVGIYSIMIIAIADFSQIVFEGLMQNL